MQPFDLFHHLLIAHEIPLMKVVEVVQEQLHVPCLFGQSQGRRLNNGPGPEVPSDPTGSASCETRSEEDRVDPGSEANKLRKSALDLSDIVRRTCAVIAGAL